MNFFSKFLVIFLLLSCQNLELAKKREDIFAGKQLSYTIENTYPHDPKAFTQGFVIERGKFYLGTGLYGSSNLRQFDLATADIIKIVNLDKQYFGEGITIVNNKIYQLTWKSKVGFIYDLDTFKEIGTFNYPIKGWGITQNEQYFILSDGTANIYFLNMDTFEEVRRIRVQFNNKDVFGLNELEYINGRIYANVWKTENIAIIDPHTGTVEFWIDLSDIVANEKTDSATVLNGIAYDIQAQKLYITGKFWSNIYEIKLTE